MVLLLLLLLLTHSVSLDLSMSDVQTCIAAGAAAVADAMPVSRLSICSMDKHVLLLLLLTQQLSLTTGQFRYWTVCCPNMYCYRGRSCGVRRQASLQRQDFAVVRQYVIKVV